MSSSTESEQSPSLSSVTNHRGGKVCTHPLHRHSSSWVSEVTLHPAMATSGRKAAHRLLEVGVPLESVVQEAPEAHRLRQGEAPRSKRRLGILP